MIQKYFFHHNRHNKLDVFFYYFAIAIFFRVKIVLKYVIISESDFSLKTVNVMSTYCHNGQSSIMYRFVAVFFFH